MSLESVNPDGSRRSRTDLLPRKVYEMLPTPTANEDSYRIGGNSQQSKSLSGMAKRGELGQSDLSERRLTDLEQEGDGAATRLTQTQNHKENQTPENSLIALQQTVSTGEPTNPRSAGGSE